MKTQVKDFSNEPMSKELSDEIMKVVKELSDNFMEDFGKNIERIDIKKRGKVQNNFLTACLNSSIFYSYAKILSLFDKEDFNIIATETIKHFVILLWEHDININFSELLQLNVYKIKED